MAGFLGDAWPWVKAFHVIAVIAWMAALLYLPRLYVYHCDAAPGSAQDATFQVMERRLLRGIMNPSMIVAVGLGVLLMMNLGAGLWSQGWWHVKVLMLVLLLAMHMAAARWRRLFAEGRNRHSPRFYRWMNEAPAVLMVVIVIMAVVRPF